MRNVVERFGKVEKGQLCDFTLINSLANVIQNTKKSSLCAVNLSITGLSWSKMFLYL